MQDKDKTQTEGLHTQTNKIISKLIDKAQVNGINGKTRSKEKLSQKTNNFHNK